jgi:rubrerythrin
VSDPVDYRQKYYETKQELAREKAEHAKAIAELTAYMQSTERVVVTRDEPAIDMYAAEMTGLKRQLQEKSELYTSAEVKIQELEAANDKLNNQFRNPHFWPSTFARPFAESLEAMREVSGSSQLDSKETVAQTFKDWHAQIEEAATQTFDGTFDLARCERARRILICQWVYLRWLEVSSLD